MKNLKKLKEQFPFRILSKLQINSLRGGDADKRKESNPPGGSNGSDGSDGSDGSGG